MPLKKGKRNIGMNIREMKKAGHSQEVAVAAAMRTAGEPKKPEKKIGVRKTK
jgi:hypothetical protein